MSSVRSVRLREGEGSAKVEVGKERTTYSSSESAAPYLIRSSSAILVEASERRVKGGNASGEIGERRRFELSVG